MLNPLDNPFDRLAKDGHAIISSPECFLGARLYRSSNWRRIELTILHHDVSELLLIDRF